MVKEQIIQWAIKDFSRLGLKSVSMSHLAQELRISKKTIYDYFSSKQELITECLKSQFDQTTVTIIEAEGCAESTLEAIISINRITFKQSLSLCPTFYYEAAKLPYAMDVLRGYVDFVCSQYQIYFQKGIEDGILPKGYNCESALLFFEEQTKAMCLNTSKNEIIHIETYATNVFTYMAGICTDKGREELAKFNKNELYK